MKQMLEQNVEQNVRRDLNPVPSRPVSTSTRDVAAPNPDFLPATAKSHAARTRNLPERPDPSANHEAYCAYLDAMCAHVRGMAVKAGRLYHAEKLAELEGAG